MLRLLSVGLLLRRDALPIQLGIEAEGRLVIRIRQGMLRGFPEP
ncbi:hypothetical protein OG613_47985 (plasmid) [Streptomyces sp. NBC_00015]